MHAFQRIVHFLTILLCGLVTLHWLCLQINKNNLIALHVYLRNTLHVPSIISVWTWLVRQDSGCFALPEPRIWSSVTWLPVQLRLAMRLQDTVHISLNNNSKYSTLIKHLTYTEQQTAPTCKRSNASSCRDNWCWWLSVWLSCWSQHTTSSSPPKSSPHGNLFTLWHSSTNNTTTWQILLGIWLPSYAISKTTRVWLGDTRLILRSCFSNWVAPKLYN